MNPLELNMSKAFFEQDYYPFGMLEPGRNYSLSDDSSFRYGFNGQERDDDVEGKGDLNTAMFWEYDTRLGRRWNLDPVPNAFASNYSAFLDNPLWRNDVLGNKGNDEFDLDKTTGKITKVSDKGGDKVDYYNVGSKDSKGQFKTEQVITIDRLQGGGNINSFRFKEDAKGTLSAFNIPGTNTSGFLLEPPGPSTTERNQDKRIPEGTYNLAKNPGSEFPNSFRLFNKDLPFDRAVLIHSGNFVNDTRACLLPGSTFGIAKMGESKVTLENAGYLRTYHSQPTLNDINNFITQKGAENVQLNIMNVLAKP